MSYHSARQPWVETRDPWRDTCSRLFFFGGPFEWPLQTTNHPGTMWLHFSRASPWHSAPWRASTETVTALLLYRTCHGCFQLVTWLHGLPEHLVFSVTPLFFVLSVSTSRWFEAGLFLDTLAQMGRKISIHGAGENPAMGWYNPHASAELVSTNMLF